MTITMRRAAINLAEAVRRYQATDEGVTAPSMKEIEDAIDALPLPFEFRAFLWDSVLDMPEPSENEETIDGDYNQEVRKELVESIRVCFTIRREQAETRGDEPFAPGFDCDRFKAHALSEDADAKWAYNKAQEAASEG